MPSVVSCYCSRQNMEAAAADCSDENHSLCLPDLKDKNVFHFQRPVEQLTMTIRWTDGNWI